MSDLLHIMLACQRAQRDGFPHFARALEKLIKDRLRLERALKVPAGRKHPYGVGSSGGPR